MGTGVKSNKKQFISLLYLNFTPLFYRRIPEGNKLLGCLEAIINRKVYCAGKQPGKDFTLSCVQNICKIYLCTHLLWSFVDATGIVSSLKGQKHFHFAKGTVINKSQSLCETFKGTPKTNQHKGHPGHQGHVVSIASR